MINEMIGHFKCNSIECNSVEEKNKYLVLDDVDENKKVLKKYEEVWEVIKKKLKPLIVAKKLNMENIF